jgi:hypothetical protein
MGSTHFPKAFQLNESQTPDALSANDTYPAIRPTFCAVGLWFQTGYQGVFAAELKMGLQSGGD